MTSIPVIAILAALFALSTQGTNAENVVWPSLKFHFNIKRSSMKVYGQSDFALFANPGMSVDGDSVLYDVFGSFAEYDTICNYTLVDGVGYSTSLPDSAVTSSVKCLDSESDTLPPINAIIRSLNEATAVSSTSLECPSENLFKVTVNSFDFALCVSNLSGFTMQGSDMDVKVEYIETPVDIQAPAIDSSHDCRTVVTPTSVTSIGKSLLTGQPISQDARKLKAAFDFSLKGLSSCSCKSKRRPCVFIHGMGVEEEMPENQDNFTDYWGDHILDKAPCCSSMKFAHLDTVNNTWTSPRQQQKVCNRALAASDTSTDSTIIDTIVVTHSMGNLMFAGALANERCSLDPSSTWVGLAAPMKGSMASDFIQKSCAGETNIVWEKIGNITGRCPASTALKSLAYEDEEYSSKRLNAAYAAAQEVYRTNVYALMCGKGFSGIPSRYQAQFWALGNMIPHNSRKNDGMVEFQSCAAGIPESEFDDSWRSRFYKTRLNHYDMEFLNGDSILNGEKMPVKWFECLL